MVALLAECEGMSWPAAIALASMFLASGAGAWAFAWCQAKIHGPK